MASPVSSPSDGPFLDIHDLAAMILHAHATVDGTPFATSKIVEVNRNGAPFQTLTDQEAPHGWFDPGGPPRRVAYALYNTPQDVPAGGKITVDTFPSPMGVFNPASDDRTLTRRELEDVFWRCKDYDQGYQLAYVAQRVFNSLDGTGIQLRARTSTGYELVFSPAELMVGTATITPREACVIMSADDSDVRPMSFSGFDGPIPWPYLVLGNAGDLDRCVALDLALPQIGGRGLGGELFALERHDDYMTRVLPLYAEVHHVGHPTLGIVPRSATDEMRTRAEALTEAVVRRLVGPGQGETDFCRYCGEPGIITCCGVCKTSYFCEPCHRLGWKYHRKWCTPFRG
ncbi:hypothetical protein TRAPUB_10842 [Trametes pubescens]|uniref:MYND-type domain-containing protein n=1 Tax=Trametes pubescens TaxID=154538 RepID=A0A1M2VYC0_TRAPU|nr:hypothetical protein TRAPUB_10842 [Trametes pubescens]